MRKGFAFPAAVIVVNFLTFNWHCHRALAQPAASNSGQVYRMALTPSDTMQVQWQPGTDDQSVQSTSLPGAISGTSSRDEEFIKSVLALLEHAMINRLSANVTLDNVAVEKGRVRLTGVLLSKADINLRLKNEGTRRLADVLYERYGRKADPPSWTQMLPLAKLGLMDDLEISLKLEELRVRELALDADALKIEGFALQADAGPDNTQTTATSTPDTLRMILRVLQRAAISRAEAHLRLDHLSAKRLKLSLDGFALKELRILIALRRSDSSSAP